VEGRIVSADRRQLFLASFLMLFVELVLIRWLGAHIAYLSFFSNFVLLGSFLGIGIGFLAVGRSDWFRRAPMWLGALVFASAVFPVTIDRTGSSLIFFGGFQTRGLPIWISLPIIFAAVAATMAAIAQGVARLFQRFPPLEAYRLDVLGSVAGIAAFAILSFIGAPPVVWGAVIVALFVFLLRPSLRIEHAVAIGLLVGAFGMEALAGSVVWSPYYRINWTQTDEETQVVVNGIPHQAITTNEARRAAEPTYFLPYERAVEPPERVLVIGAGTGADVAIALAEGAGAGRCGRDRPGTV
jgi:MFS family permease